MLKRYRRQFILLNMCLIGAVLALMLILVGVYMYHDYYDELKTTMSEVVKPLSSSMFSGTAKPPQEAPPDVPQRIPDQENKSKKDTARGRPNLSSKDRKGIVTIFYTQSTGELSILSDEQIFDEDTIAEAVLTIGRQEEDFGILQEYGMIYYRAGGNGPYRIAIASTAYLRGSMMDLCLILIGIFLISMALFYFVSRRISLLAIQPLEKAMAREKQFVADASHDLKTPLTVILANSSILQSNPQSTVSAQMKWIDSTAAAARNMQAMINNLLTLSSVEASETAVELKKVDFSDAVEKAVLQMESVAYDSGIELTTEIEPGVYICADQDYTLHIIGSLIENALKYEPRNGSVLVWLRSERGQAVLSVTNPNGVIDQEDLPHIFDRFYRADKTRDAKGGHGLGLAIAKRMTEATGGTISAESTDKSGTRFTVVYRLF